MSISIMLKTIFKSGSPKGNLWWNNFEKLHSKTMEEKTRDPPALASLAKKDFTQKCSSSKDSFNLYYEKGPYTQDTWGGIDHFLFILQQQFHGKTAQIII